MARPRKDATVEPSEDEFKDVESGANAAAPEPEIVNVEDPEAPAPGNGEIKHAIDDAQQKGYVGSRPWEDGDK